jgi:hypothetical protein
MKKIFEMKRISIWSVIRVVFIIFLVMGIIVGLLYGITLSSFGFLLSALGEYPLDAGFPLLRNLGFVMIPIIAIFYAVFGTIAAIIWTLIYNVVASIVGGIELELEERGVQVHRGPEAPDPREQTQGTQ